ncbi:hypothetical protein RF55_23931 [Lasius niger]|uniref:Uncharacterized protein n=1 Tax=Lasius niger TaxID=67767 RepID=A0A0J7JWC1_LASNI|nr:hypothetical protein RF55_23931 [Lasius niger]
MNSSEIHNVLSRDPHTCRYYVGVFPSDKIPDIAKFPAAMVINTDKHHEKGSHWLALYIENPKTLDFFDSFGLPPDIYGEDISRFVKTYEEVHWNSVPVQSLTSNVCGQFCIYFIVKRCQGFCMKMIDFLFNY